MIVTLQANQNSAETEIVSKVCTQDFADVHKIYLAILIEDCDYIMFGPGREPHFRTRSRGIGSR